ncbi:MAG: tetraacyldisaccharide 4'-kinase [Thermodesulfobacteriota bacterium]|nr:tetraacyldisaccharide 4'-kinase [Thermodesulfobacteriota bacterium]
MERVIQIPLFPLSLLYRIIVQTRCLFYKRNVLQLKQLPCRVISVGNISLGGSGKTPTTHYIAQLLHDQGFQVAVLSRGYKGKARNKINLVSNGHEIFLNPRDSGDEPYMLATKLNGVPVLTSKDRFKTGKYAIEHFGSSILILDDGFQHIQLKRDLDILLLDSQVMAGNTYLFPRGILREPLKNMKRADLFLVTRSKDPRQNRELETTIKEIKEDAMIFYGNFQPKCLINPFGETIGLNSLKDKRVLAFSGIAHPEYFTASLNELGATVVQELAFTDHHWYSHKDYEKIRRISREVDITVTTEKDMVKIDNSFLRDVKVCALRIKLFINREEAFRQFLLERVRNRK